jgi:alanyl-tRNA synthetase
VNATERLVSFKSESSVSAGVRRVEALTGEKHYNYNEQLTINNQLRTAQIAGFSQIGGEFSCRESGFTKSETMENEKLSQYITERS